MGGAGDFLSAIAIADAIIRGVVRYFDMKKLMTLLLLALPLWGAAQDYDFAKRIGSNTLYFSILSSGGKNGATVEVSFPGSEEKPWKGFAKPSGEVSIPEVVTPDRSKAKGADPEDDDTTAYTVVSVRYNAFQDCDRITRLVLPPSVKKVEENAFSGCKRINYIVVQAAEPPRMDESAFDGVDLDIPLRVPTGTYELYKEAIGWRLFREILEY